MTDQPMENKLSPEHLLTLYKISGEINSTLDFDEALDRAIDGLMLVTRAQRGFLMIADHDAGTLDVHVARNIDGDTIESEGYSTTIVNKVVETEKSLLTNNAQFDTRINAGQSIILRGLRAILCAPMLVRDRLIGVVYVDTTMKAGAFHQSDQELLEAACGIAARAIENARLFKVAVEKGRLERELQMASEIQRNLLPKSMPQVAGYELAPYWVAAREVAGDFYDAFELKNGHLGTVIADVSDKGAPAALFMAVARTLLRSSAYGGASPVDTMWHTNDLLVPDAEESGMFVTVFYTEFRPDGTCINVNGGHNPPALYRAATGDVEYMPTGGRALGWFPGNVFEAIEVQLQPGDIIVYYTDGLTEAENPVGEPYGEDRLAEAIKKFAAKPASLIRDDILEDVDVFCDGNPPFDDITMLVVCYTG